MKLIDRDIKRIDQDIVINGLYQMFWLTQKTELDDQYYFFWLTQEEGDSNNMYGNHNKQLYHCDLIIGILDASMYQNQLVPKFLLTQLVSDIYLICYRILLQEETSQHVFHPLDNDPDLFFFDCKSSFDPNFDPGFYPSHDPTTDTNINPSSDQCPNSSL